MPGGPEEDGPPLGAGCLTTRQAAEAEESTVAEAEATASLSEAAASPPEAAGCPGEAARTGAEGGASPSEL